MNIGERVLIGGRTMLRPGVSLVGLEGIVTPAIPGAPAGCTTVLIDWKGQGYEDDDLPMLINVPTDHLEPITTPTALIDTPILSGAPHAILGLVPPENHETTPQNDDAKAPFSADEKTEFPEDDEENRPRLRLV